MNDFLIHWQLLIIPLAVMIISQFVKVVLETKATGFEWRHLNSYGGMPSSHTAFFVSIALMLGFVEGFDSAVFMLGAFVALVFIRDAVGIRRALGHHGKVLNYLLQKEHPEARKDLPEKLEERLGHTEAQVIAGAVLSVLLTTLFYALIK